MPRQPTSNVDRSVTENGFMLKEVRSWCYSAEPKTDANYADDIVLLANSPTITKSLLHSLQQTTGDIGLHTNTNKTDHMYFKWGASSPRSSRPQKLNYKFTYNGINISFTESDINIPQVKVWTAIGKLSIIWKTDLSDKMKRNFFLSVTASILPYGCPTVT